MFDIGFSELLLIVVAGLVFVGPKELPTIIRAVSRGLKQCREIIDECKAQLDEMMVESGVKDALAEAKTDLVMEKKYITDQYGQLRETYDISDILMERKTAATAESELEPTPEPEHSISATPIIIADSSFSISEKEAVETTKNDNGAS